MKLIIEKHPDLIRLSSHLKRIETLADRMGIDVDDLLTDHKHTHISIHPSSFRQDEHAFSNKRAAIFIHDHNRPSPLNPLTGLTILFNRSEE